ncbi:MAG: L,D-transpeptidase [Lachnospiraceae bacterium]|nr:L,D-transpeptidase [Lachnospiraceae bacterium]
MRSDCKFLCFRKIVVFCLAVCICVGILLDSTTLTAEAKETKPAYLIMVNRAANCVTVYEKDAEGEFRVPVKAFVCSCGREGHETPLGTFKTSDYYTWRLMVDGSYGQYAVRFNKGIMFHSVPYYTKNAGNMEWEQYNLLGEPASLGCVRLTCADAKWIYDNCKAGTQVVVYDDAENPGPLGKPEEVKLTAENPMRKWDPTDMNSKNPWNQVRPTLYLTGAVAAEEVIVLPVGASPRDIYNAIGLMDAAGGVYGSGEYIINISGKYDLNRQGTYNISVRGVGVLGVRTEKNLILHII